MKKIKRIPGYLAGFIVFALMLLYGSYAGALTSGETYTITVQKIASDGSLGAVSSTSTATADSDGKIAFEFSSVPDNSSCNFLLVTVKDSASATVRRSMAPCPNAGEALPMGVSGLTGSQTDALLAALAAAGTDDPILAVFGYAIVRSSSITASELIFMASLCNQAINNSGGFVDYLTSNGVTSAQIALYRSYIIDRLANTATGYSKLIKDSVDASSDAEKFNARGEAASKLLLVLVQAATDAGFSQDRVLEAFNAMGSVVKPLMTQGIIDGDITATTEQMIDSSIGGGIQKLKADKDIEKYSAALTTLGASGTDVENYQDAADTLVDAMSDAFKAFEQVFDGDETDSDIQTSQTAMDSAMQAAFNQFMNDTAAAQVGGDTSRITQMIANIDAALGSSTSLPVSQFMFYKSDGTQSYWPLTMVILTDWISSIVASGGDLSYTRDATTVPSNWGSCDDGQYHEQSDCTGNGGTWTARGRTTFGAGGMEIPASYAAMFGIQEDIMILEMNRWMEQSSAGQQMSEHERLEREFSEAVTNLASNISGTTDGTTAISTTQKNAIVTLLKSPQF